MAYKIKLLFFSIDPHWYLRKKVHLFCVLLIDVFYCWPNKRKEKQRCEQSFIVRSVISCNRVIFPPQTHVSGPYPVLKVLKVGYCTTYSYRDSKNAISFFGSEGRNAIGPPVASDQIIRRVRRNITMLNSKPISWCKVIHLECQTSWQGCFRRVELCFFCCFLCYRNGVHSLVLQIIGLV